MTDTTVQVTANNGSEIAIIGMIGRFPGAASTEEFWRNLRDGVESVTFFTDEELLASGIDSTSLTNPNYVKAGRYIEDIDMFDASFFGFSPREAEILDPQQRIFLECSWEALENAGYEPKTYDGLIGIFAGVSANSYIWNILANRELFRTVGQYQTTIGNDKDFLATRVSYKLGLQGSSMTIQTACSTSLVAVHIACQSLLNGESDLALAGGVSVTVPQKNGYWFREEGILSPDGHCRAFDENAQGTVSGMGVGVVVLKRLDDALADGDYIHAVIKGSAVNNDGSMKVGYTAPSVEGQAQVIKMAQQVASVDPETISYIETHGTGTVLGDPIEIAALTKAFRAETEKKGFCAIGSVKTNIGHLDVAAGVSGLIKTVLALQHKQLPPSLNFERPNPRIDFENSPFFVNSKLTEWKNGNGPRRAGVSSFGIGGTNAHVIVEESPRHEHFDSLRQWQLLTVSAKSRDALDAATARLVSHLRNNRELNLADVAYTLQVGRRAFSHRRMLVCRDVSDVMEVSQRGHKRIEDGDQVAEKPSVVFMFPGQGTQYIRMAEELYQRELLFRQHFDRCCDLLRTHLELDLRDVLYSLEENTSVAEEQLRRTSVTQPALFSIEYALAQMWMAWGIVPRAMIGHSIGEYVAACIARVMSLEDALWLVARRGAMMQELQGGAMLAVPLPETDIVETMGEGLSLAAVNSSSLCVVSGDEVAVDEYAERLSAQGVNWRRLHTSHAFHSAMMDQVLAEFAREVSKVKLNAPKIPYISNVTGTWIQDAEAIDPQYWATHLRQTVRFAAGLEELAKQPGGIFLEVGPGKTLTMLAQSRADRSSSKVLLTSLRHANEQGSDEAFLLTTLGRLWLSGAPVNWRAFYANERRQRVPLPTYPFERQRYWVEPQVRSGAAAKHQGALEKKPDIGEWFYLPSWQRSAPVLSFESQLHQKVKNGWLIFEDECGLGSQMAERLRHEEEEVYTVKAGERFVKSEANAYVIDPQKSSDYRALLEDVFGQCQLNKIVYLWNVTPEDSTPSDIELVNSSASACFYSLLFLAQAIGAQKLSATLTLEIVSNRAQEVVAGDVLCAEKTTALGLSKVISQEYHRVDCRAIDVALPKTNSQEKELVDLLLAEACAHGSDPVVAYRGAHRWTQVFEQIKLDESQQGNHRLREGGVYLITGGLGGFGLSFAKYLAQRAHAKLVLVGRAALPGREEWTEWLSTHDAEDETSLKIKEVLALEAEGAEVSIESADVADIKRMREVLAHTRKRFGRIDGVIHTAGVAAGGLIELKESQAVAAVFAPKVLGTLVLDELLKETPLDFFIICSSLASFLGGVGQADYVAANSFMDAFAYQRNLKGSAFTASILWDTWQQVGMAANTAVPSGLEKEREESLKQGISPREGADVLGRILSGSTSSRVIVSTKDFNLRVLRSRLVKVGEDRPETKSKPLSQTAHQRPELAKAYLAPRDETEQSLVEIWEELFGIDGIGVDDDFIELGGHSLLAMQLLSRIRETFQVEIVLRTLFESPTVAGLAFFITQNRDGLNVAGGLVQRIQRDEDEQLLSKLDELSEEEVEALLSDMLAESEAK